jgi:RNase P subunit RPR2
MTGETMTRPEFVEFRCPECQKTTRFAIGIREGVPSDRPGALDYFPGCRHCGAELRITILERPRRTAPSLRALAAFGGLAVLLLTWAARRSGER